MPCYHPLKAWKASIPGKTGKFGFIFNPVPGQLAMSLPCGQCIGCRLERSRQWAVRCVHEASLYTDNCFITLTYDDQSLPIDRSLDKTHFQLFMKRLRKKFGSGVRYFHAGEYGERFGRPHYHACLFNFDFHDKILWKVVNDHRIYTSLALSELWDYGFCTVGSVTFESAAYVARYVTKKITGDRAKEHYTYIDESTGEFFVREPEYATMSLKPGIGADWLKKYSTDVFPDDFVVVRGMKAKPPRYYSKQYEIANINDAYRLKMRRMESAKRRAWDTTPDRLQVREQVKLACISQLKRGLEDDT